MATQKALFVREIGKPMVLVEDHQIPQPKQGQVQVKVSVAGLIPSDHFSRDWGLIISPDLMPAILGKDVVGKVTKLGEGVTRLKVGDRVASRADITPGWEQSGLQEFAIMDVSDLTKIPDGITDDEAATLPTNLSTIFGSLFITLGIASPWATSATTAEHPESMLIVGGGSACGQFATQVSKLAGVPKIIVVGGDEEELQKRGATHFIDRHAEEGDIVKRIRDIVGDELIYAFDTVSRPDGLGLALKALSSHKKGKMARLLPMGVVDEQTARGHEVLDVFGNNFTGSPVSIAMWERLAGYLESGVITPTNFEVREPHGLRADVVNAALDDYRDGKRVVKPHIHIG